MISELNGRGNDQLTDNFLLASIMDGLNGHEIPVNVWTRVGLTSTGDRTQDLSQVQSNSSPCFILGSWLMDVQQWLKAVKNENDWMKRLPERYCFIVQSSMGQWYKCVTLWLWPGCFKFKLHRIMRWKVAMKNFREKMYRSKEIN